MVADTVTPLLGLLVMGTGNDNNSWGDNFNNSILTPIENAIAGVRQVTVNANPYTLSAADLVYNAMTLNGTISADQVIIVPDKQRQFLFFNNLSGAFFCIIKAGAGGTVLTNLPVQKITRIFCAGTGAAFREDNEKVGELFYFAGTAAPPGSVACDGTAYKRASAVSLFAAISTTWGNNDGTDFKVPNAQDTGRYLRSKSGSLAVGVSQANQNAAHTHTITGAPGVGTLGTDSQGSHTHTVTDPGHVHAAPITQSGYTVSAGPTSLATITAPSGAVLDGANVTGISLVAGGAHTHAVTGAPTVGTLATASSGGTEARPESLVGLLCIRY